MATATDKVKQIETLIWEKIEGGYVKPTGRRLVKDVAKDLEKALTKAKLPFEYVSTNGEKENALWPKGDTFVALEVGGNEGYSLFVCVREFATAPSHTFTMNRPIRVKLLTTREEALEVFGFAFYLLGS